MIPKIAHFHWEGGPISWLRIQGLASFIRLNPRWEVRLHRTPDHIRECKILTYAQGADWTWYEVVNKYGGFCMHTDTIFIRPIPDEWCDYDFCGCTNNTGNLYHCFYGSRASHPFLEKCIASCNNMKDSSFLDYQDMGILLMKKIVDQMGGLESFENFLDMPMSAFCPVSPFHVSKLWNPGDLELPDDVVGITWFGGDESSRKREYFVPQEFSNSAIVKLALQA